MTIRGLLLLLLAACSNPTARVPPSVPAAAANPLARGVLLAVAGANDLRSAGWIGGERVVAMASDRLWLLDPKHPDEAATVTMPRAESLRTSIASDVFAVNRYAVVDVYRGLGIVRSFQAPRGASEEFAAVSLSPDGQYVALAVNDVLQTRFLIGEVDTGIMHGPFVGDKAEFDATGAFVLIGDAVYSSKGRPLFKASQPAGTDNVALMHVVDTHWIGTTAFVFGRNGLDAYDTTTRKARYQPLECLPGTSQYAAVDTLRQRVVRICGNRAYVLQWPSRALQRFALPDKMRKDRWTSSVRFRVDDPGFSLAVESDEGASELYRVEADGAARELSDAGPEATNALCSVVVPRHDYERWCTPQLSPGGRLALSVDPGLLVVDVRTGAEVVRVGIDARANDGESHAVSLDDVLVVRHGDATRYHFGPTAPRRLPPPSPEARCGSWPSPIWRRGPYSLSRSTQDGKQCACTPAGCTHRTDDARVLDLNADRVLVAELPKGATTSVHIENAAGHTLVTRDVAGRCSLGLFTRKATGVLLLCSSDGPSDAVELRASDLFEVARRALPTAEPARDVEPYRDGALVTTEHSQHTLRYGEHVTPTTLLAWSDFGILHGNDALEIAGDRGLADRVLWCLEPGGGNTSIAHPFSACKARWPR